MLILTKPDPETVRRALRLLAVGAVLATGTLAAAGWVPARDTRVASTCEVGR